MMMMIIIIIIIMIYEFTNIYLSRCYFYIVPVFFFVFLGVTLLVFWERFCTLLCYVPLHFTSRWFARKHYPVSLHRYNCFLDHLRSLGGFYCFYILLHLLFYGPPSHQNHSPTASHILPVIPSISFLDFKIK